MSAIGGVYRTSLPAGVRQTPQRRAVVAAVEESEGAFTVLEIHERARRAEPNLGLATAYRTVELLRRTGSIRPLAADGRPTYIRCHREHHHHLVCLSCGGIEETSLCAAPSSRDLVRAHGFTPQAHELEIYGTCARCAA